MVLCFVHYVGSVSSAAYLTPVFFKTHNNFNVNSCTYDEIHNHEVRTSDVKLGKKSMNFLSCFRVFGVQNLCFFL